MAPVKFLGVAIAFAAVTHCNAADGTTDANVEDKDAVWTSTMQKVARVENCKTVQNKNAKNKTFDSQTK